MQFSGPNIVGRSSGSSRRAAVSSSRDPYVGSELDPHRSRTRDASPGALHKSMSAQRSPPVGPADPKRSASGRHTGHGHVKNYDSALKGIEGLQLENDERVHY